MRPSASRLDARSALRLAGMTRHGGGRPLLLRARLDRAEALEGNLGGGVGFLQLHAPIAQIGQHDRLARHRAAHEVAGCEHLELAVEKAQPCFALEAEQPFESVHFSCTATLVSISGRLQAPRAKAAMSIQMAFCVRQCRMISEAASPMPMAPAPEQRALAAARCPGLAARGRAGR